MGLETSFVGRDEVARQVETLIVEEQLITITGAGGIGKTRLASNVAAARAAAGESTALVELAPARPGDDLELTFGRSLGQRSIETFVVGLDGRRSLVVLDNCEHLATDAAALAAQLIGFPNIRVLATSRSPLGIAGEYVVKLGPLGVPADGEDESSPGFELFLDRATTAGAAWLQTPEQRTAAAEIVRRLDGVPLAIELAAARSRVVGPTDLLTMLPRQLDLLDGTGRSDVAEHGVREVVSSSYEPLDPKCKQAFRTLSLIPHGVDLEFAHALIGEDDQIDTLNVLTRLIDQSLVYTSPGAGGDLVYRLLEPVRAFGLEQLQLQDELREVGDRYVDVVGAFAYEIVVATATSFSSDLLGRIAQRYSHLLHAVEIALEIDDHPGRCYQLLLPLYAPTSAPRREQAALAAKVRSRWPDTPDRFRAAAYAIMGHVALWAGTEDPATLAREALDDPSATRIARIIALRVIAFDANHRGDRIAARAHIESALETAAARGGSFERELRMSWASLVNDPTDRAEAIETAETMSRLAAEAGENVTVVWGACVCVHQRLLQGDLPGARLAAEQASAFAAHAVSPWPTASAERAEAVVCTAEGQWESARSHFLGALESVIGNGDIEGVTLTVRMAAVCAQHSEQNELAAALWRSVPSRFRPSTLPPLFIDAEVELLQSVGEPIPVEIVDAVRSARQLLTGTIDDDDNRINEDNSEADELADDTSRSRQVYRFNGFVLDPERRELLEGDRPVHVEPQVFDVLLRLIEDAGIMVARDQLMDDVWGSRFVSASALTSRIKSVRAAVGDDGKAQKVVRTVHGRGFMFVAELKDRPTGTVGRSDQDQPARG